MDLEGSPVVRGTLPGITNDIDIMRDVVGYMKHQLKT